MFIGKSQRLDGNEVENTLALFPDRAEERESGWHRRLLRVRPGERTCLLFFKVTQTNQTTN
jgi:hypothetical protein